MFERGSVTRCPRIASRQPSASPHPVVDHEPSGILSYFPLPRWYAQMLRQAPSSAQGPNPSVPLGWCCLLFHLPPACWHDGQVDQGGRQYEAGLYRRRAVGLCRPNVMTRMTQTVNIPSVMHCHPLTLDAVPTGARRWWLFAGKSLFQEPRRNLGSD